MFDVELPEEFMEIGGTLAGALTFDTSQGGGGGGDSGVGRAADQSVAHVGGL